MSNGHWTQGPPFLYTEMEADCGDFFRAIQRLYTRGGMADSIPEIAPRRRADQRAGPAAAVWQQHDRHAQKILPELGGLLHPRDDAAAAVLKPVCPRPHEARAFFCPAFASHAFFTCRADRGKRSFAFRPILPIAGFLAPSEQSRALPPGAGTASFTGGFTM